MLRFLVVLGVFASGCSLLGLGDNSDAYLEAQIAPPLEIPSGLDDSTISDLMVVPPVSATASLTRERRVPQPGQLLARATTDPVKIQRLGERHWLVIAEAPSSIWPKVIQFLADNGVQVVEEVPREGYLRTQGLSLGNARYRDVVRRIISESDQRARQVELRMRVEQGIRDGNTEIHVRYLRESDAARAPWPEGSSNADVEYALLMELGGYLRADLDRVAFSIRGQEISSRPKAWLAKREEGPWVLRLRMDYGRAWAMVVSAFANAEVNVTDADRESAIMFVDMDRDILQGEAGGFFSFFGGDEESLEIRLQPWQEGFDVTVYQDQAPAPAELGERVLMLIREYAT